MTLQTAFLGLGVMGFAMAGHLASTHPTNVWNRSLAKAKQWGKCYQGTVAASAQAAVATADVVCLCLGRDEDVAQVVLGEFGILRTLPSGSILIDHTTTSRQLAVALAQACAQQGVYFLDAPVSGGQIGAEQGTLAIMIGGEASVVVRAKPVLDCYAKRLVHIGAHGAGQVAKMVNQVCIAHLLQGLSEGLTIAKMAQLDTTALLSAISSGAAQSWQMDNRATSMCEDSFDFGFAINWMIKDLGYALDYARTLGVPLDDTLGPIRKQYQQLAERGYSRSDTSALIKQFDQDGALR